LEYPRIFTTTAKGIAMFPKYTFGPGPLTDADRIRMSEWFAMMVQRAAAAAPSAPSPTPTRKDSSMHTPDSFSEDPRQAVHALFREWVQTLRDRDNWTGTYAALAAELHTILATTRGDLGHIAKLIKGDDMALAPLLADAASMFTRSGWLVGIGDHTVHFTRSG
jgi:hypothetical protein